MGRGLEELARSFAQAHEGMTLSAKWEHPIERKAKEAEQQRAQAEKQERRGLPPEPEHERERQGQSRG